MTDHAGAAGPASRRPRRGGRRITRRQFVAGAAGVAAVAGAAGLAGPLPERLARAAAARPARLDLSQVKHLVFLMQENRSFDHYFGTFPGARGFADPAAIRLPDGRPVFQQPDPASPGGYLEPFHMSTITTGAAAVPSLSHGWRDQHACWNHGAMDGWLQTHVASDGDARGPFTMGYYTREDLPFHWALAEAFTLADNYHCSVLGPTDPNRLFWEMGSCDPQGLAGGPVLETGGARSLTFETAPQMMHRAGISCKYYWYPSTGAARADYGSYVSCGYYFRQFQAPGGVPAALYHATVGGGGTLFGDGTPGGIGDPERPTPARNPRTAFEEDCANGVLPDVSFIGTGGDEHPPDLPALGAQFIAAKLEALAGNEDLWNSTVFVISYDENDGFFDHVPPPVPDRGAYPEEYVTATSAAGTDGGGLPVGAGFRVPCFIVSPWSTGGRVFSGVSDHTSCLRLVESVAAAGGLSGNGPVTIGSISRWRRDTFGDLTGALAGARRPAPASARFDPAATAANVAAQTAAARQRLPRPVLAGTRTGRQHRAEKPGTGLRARIPYTTAIAESHSLLRKLVCSSLPVVVEEPPVTHSRKLWRAAGSAALIALAAGCSSATSGGGSPASSGTSASGGTATIDMASAPDSLDPQYGYTVEAAEADWITYTPLLTYAHANGVAGTRVIPGLATALPVVSDGGKTYTLTLRSGLKFSDGTAVKASDFSYAIERMLKLNWGGDSFFTQTIVGAAQYLAGKASSISGITADNASGKITIQLTAPYGAFDNLLAFPSAAPVPAGTAMKNLPASPPPGVGAYVIKNVIPNQSFEMVKSPNFASFHIPGIPVGHLSTIKVSIVTNTTTEAEQVLDNQADNFDAADTVPAALMSQIKSQAASRFSLQPVETTDYFFLNQSKAPFDNKLAREAVNIAINRQAFQRLAGGTITPGCYLLAAGLVGHPTKACPWGTLNSADVAKAKGLIQQAHLTGAPVTVYGEQVAPVQQWVEYYAGVLKSIGFNVTIKFVDGSTYFPTVGSKAADPQTGYSAWSQDFPNPVDFYLLVDASSIQPVGNRNRSYVRDPHIQSELARLDAVPTSQLQSVAGQWSALDYYTAQQADEAVFGYGTAPKFFSDRIDASAAVFSPISGNDWSTWQLSS